MNARLEHGSLATVLGGTGFVGRYAVRALASDGWRIRAATRRPDLAGHLQPMGAVGQIQPVQANLRYPDSIKRAVEGAEAVVNLVGILVKSGPQTFHAVHVAGARAAAKAAKEAGAKTFVHVSAIGADRKSWASYGRTKAAGEAAVLAEFPEAVILRPSLVFGPEDQLFNRFAAMARYLPVPAADRRRQDRAAAGLRRRCRRRRRSRAPRCRQVPHHLRAGRARRCHLPPAAGLDADVVGAQALVCAHSLLAGAGGRISHRASAQHLAAPHR